MSSHQIKINTISVGLNALHALYDIVITYHIHIHSIFKITVLNTCLSKFRFNAF
jgi:hypothetical protein